MIIDEQFESALSEAMQDAIASLTITVKHA